MQPGIERALEAVRIVPPPRCWADSGFRKVTNGDTGVETDVPLECNAIGYEPLGLCRMHNLDILGREVDE